MYISSVHLTSHSSLVHCSTARSISPFNPRLTRHAWMSRPAGWLARDANITATLTLTLTQTRQFIIPYIYIAILYITQEAVISWQRPMKRRLRTISPWTVVTPRSRHVVWKRSSVRLVLKWLFVSGENSSLNHIVPSTWGSPNTGLLS